MYCGSVAPSHCGHPRTLGSGGALVPGFGLQPHPRAALLAPCPHVHTQGTGETNVQEHIVVALWKQVTAETCRFAGRSQDFPSLRQLAPCWLTGAQKVEIPQDERSFGTAGIPELTALLTLCAGLIHWF